VSGSAVHRDIKFDRFELRPVARHLLVEGQPVCLAPFDVQMALVERRERWSPRTGRRRLGPSH
jgi:hypothetical protein